MDFGTWSPPHTLLADLKISDKPRSRHYSRKDEIEMDFSAWSPSHTILVAITLVTFGVQLSEVRSDMNQGFSDLRGEMNQRLSDMQGEIKDVRSEISKLNQNHIDHLSHQES